MRPTPPTARPRRKLAILIPVRAVAGLIVLGFGLGIMNLLIATREDPARVEAPERAIVVETIRAERVSVPRVSTGFGTARPRHAANITAEVSGPVRLRPSGIDPGRWVERGELLLEIDPREYEDRLAGATQTLETIAAQIRAISIDEESLRESLALAEEAVRLTQNELERREQAFADGSVNRFELEVVQRDLTRAKREAETLRQQAGLIPMRRDQLRAQLESQRATVRLAELDVERCSIRAPLSGVIQEVSFEQGERVSAGMQVARIVDLRRIEIPISMPMSSGSVLRLGDPVDLQPSGAAGGLWSGQVSRLAPEADPVTRTITVYVEVEQEIDRSRQDRRGLLLPGQFVMARVLSPSEGERVIVPRSAVVRDRVRVVGENGRLQTRSVRQAYAIDRVFPTIHPVAREWFVLESGLEGGETIVVAGADDLSEGTLVEAVDAVHGRRAETDSGDRG